MKSASQIVTDNLNSKNQVTAKGTFLADKITMADYTRWSELELRLVCGELSGEQLSELADFVSSWSETITA